MEEREDLCDLNAATTRNQGKPGVAWAEAKTALGPIRASGPTVGAFLAFTKKQAPSASPFRQL